MKYFSTRGGSYQKSFEEIILDGISKEDGGLYIPHYIPKINIDHLLTKTWTFDQLAFYIFRLYINELEINDDDLKTILTKSFEKFRVENVVQLKKMSQNFYILELFHGPSYSFKDIALQVLVNLISHFKGKTGATFLCATSGDTGSALINSVIGNDSNLSCVVLFPNFGMSNIQKAQMTTINNNRIKPIQVNGSFDDCQKIVKQVLNENNHFISANSINWIRILTQMVYYFYSYLNVKSKVNFSVPTGNFGDILAGFYAYKMGLPINKLNIAINDNDSLYRFMQNGVYEPKEVKSTISPAMDISKPSNFERLLWHTLYDHLLNVDKTCSEINSMTNSSSFKVKRVILNSIKEIFSCEKVSDEEIISEIKNIYKSDNYIIDPHTAVGIKSFKKSSCLSEDIPTICLATAHPGKFQETITLALGDSDIDVVPDELNKLLSLKEYYYTIDSLTSFY